MAPEYVQAAMAEKFGYRNFVEVWLEDNGAQIIES
jgi:hypothetical protein